MTGEREYPRIGAGLMAALSLVVGASLVCPTAAHACSLSPCRAADVFPEKGSLPQDLVAFTFRPPRDFGVPDGGVAAPHLYRVDGDVRSEVPVQVTPLGGAGRAVLIEPVDKLPPGTKLVLEADAPSCAPTSKLAASYVVTEAAALPASLGTLQFALARGPLRVGTRAGSCSEELDVTYADLTLQLAPAAQPLGDVLDYQWMVDGAPYDGFVRSIQYGIGAPRFDMNGHSQLGRGIERVWATCQPNGRSDALISAVAPGEHRVSLRGTLRTGATVETPEVTFQLACDGGAPTVADAGSPGHDAATTATTTVPQSSTAAPAVAVDSGVDAGSDGCSMGHSPRSRAAVWLLALTVLGYGLAQRRRRS